MKVCENCEYPLVGVRWYGIPESYCFNCAASGDPEYGMNRKQTDELNSQLVEATNRKNQINKLLNGHPNLDSQERASELLDSWIAV